ncbi:MAG: hypothetical protein IAX21_00610 [Candidatus Bathyarchaeota archaeon]|nr:hypothetical protein [Candidatus Bathyarchaeum tardum]WGM90520.1 MAG: hypothetical protein NUK63_05195 [Candidatus Bathyarchaeum tardum]WNZ29405.1 MAG: hypothetical protein IAX21_00610 [Candidatus Bathyarchaeota archaeon]
MKKKQRNAVNQRCKACKEAIVVSKIYCRRLGEYVEDLVYCPYFKQRPPVELHAV